MVVNGVINEKKFTKIYFYSMLGWQFAGVGVVLRAGRYFSINCFSKVGQALVLDPTPSITGSETVIDASQV